MTELVVIRDYRGDEKILPYSYIKDITYKERQFTYYHSSNDVSFYFY